MDISPEWEEQLWAYIAGIAIKKRIRPIQIGGFDNHIHALVEPYKSINIPTILQVLKAYSSKWINESGYVPGRFRWQDGYGAFSVSPIQKPIVIEYIKRQREHHQLQSFEDEYRELLDEHSIEFEERFLFG